MSDSAAVQATTPAGYILKREQQQVVKSREACNSNRHLQGHE